MMTSSLRRLAGLLAAVAVASVPGVAAAAPATPDDPVPRAPAAAAPAVTPGCSGDTCNGRYAGAMNCNADQRAVASWPLYFTAAGTPLPTTLYYSPACHSTWADLPFDQDFGQRVELWAQPEYGGRWFLPLDASGGTYQKVPNTSPVVYRTTMVNWDDSVLPCYRNDVVPAPETGPPPDDTRGECPTNGALPDWR